MLGICGVLRLLIRFQIPLYDLLNVLLTIRNAIATKKYDENRSHIDILIIISDSTVGRHKLVLFVVSANVQIVHVFVLNALVYDLQGLYFEVPLVVDVFNGG